MFLPLVALNLLTISVSAFSFTPVWVCQKVVVTGSPNFTSDAVEPPGGAGPQAASAGRTASEAAPAAAWRTNFRREMAMGTITLLEDFRLPSYSPTHVRHLVLRQGHCTRVRNLAEAPQNRADGP